MEDIDLNTEKITGRFKNTICDLNFGSKEYLNYMTTHCK